MTERLVVAPPLAESFLSSGETILWHGRDRRTAFNFALILGLVSASFVLYKCLGQEPPSWRGVLIYFVCMAFFAWRIFSLYENQLVVLTTRRIFTIHLKKRKLNWALDLSNASDINVQNSSLTFLLAGPSVLVDNLGKAVSPPIMKYSLHIPGKGKQEVQALAEEFKSSVLKLGQG